jgi:hypothetical protein
VLGDPQRHQELFLKDLARVDRGKLLGHGSSPLSDSRSSPRLQPRCRSSGYPKSSARLASVRGPNHAVGLADLTMTITSECATVHTAIRR